MITDLIEELAEPISEYDSVYRGYIYKSKVQLPPEKAYIINVLTNVNAQVTPALKEKLRRGETWFYASRWYYNPWMIQATLIKRLAEVEVPEFLKEAIQMEIDKSNITNHVNFYAPLTIAIRHFILKNVETDDGLYRMLSFPDDWERASVLRSNVLDDEEKEELVKYFKFRGV